MREFNEQEIESRIPTGIPEHHNKNDIPQGEDPNEYLQAEELNKIVKFLDENTSIIKILMENSNEVMFDVNNYIKYYRTDDELEDILNNGIENKIYYNSNTNTIVIGDLDNNTIHVYNFDDFGKISTVNNIEPDANKNVNLGLDDIAKKGSTTSEPLTSFLYMNVQSRYNYPSKDTPYSIGLTYDNVIGTKVSYMTPNSGRLDIVASTVGKGLTRIQKYQDKDGILATTDDIQAIFSQATNWTNANQRFSGLVDKSADATYNVFPVLDNNGNLAKASKPFFAFKNFLTQCTIAESTELGQLLNGGQGSAGAISVNMISPPLFQKENNNNYIVLRGANLNLNVTDMSIKILRASDSVELATVPNSQIQLMSDGLSLVFYYNFYPLNTGSFKLKITSGVKTYITTLNFTIVNEVTNIDFDAITWNKVIDTAIVSTDRSYGSKRNFLLDSVVSSTKTLPSTSLLSSVLFNAGEDFYIEVLINTGTANLSLNDIFRMGLCYSTTENSLEFLPFHFFGYNKSGGGQMLFTKVNPNSPVTRGNSTSTSSQAITISFTKISNVVTVTDGVQTGVVNISNNSGYRLSAQLIGVTDTCSGQIVKAFKFN